MGQKNNTEKLILVDRQLTQMKWAVVALVVVMVVILSTMQSLAGNGMDLLVKDVMTYCL